MGVAMMGVATDVFQFDEQYQDNEDKYKLIKAEILEEGDRGGSSSDSEEESSEEEDSEDEGGCVPV